YDLNEYRLSDDGSCLGCGARLPGVYEGPAGDWGRKRQPVRLREPTLRPGAHDRRRPVAAPSGPDGEKGDA
ncbi:MAG: hypothetical protein ACRDXX_01120, partial [Stackebrandtia sp.]